MNPNLITRREGIREILASAMLLASGVYAVGIPPVISRRREAQPPAATAVSAGITASVWQTFDWGNTTLNATNLGTGNKGSDAGTWALTDASSILSIGTSGQKNITKKVNNQSDPAVNGLVVDLTAGAACTLKDTFTAPPNADIFGAYCWVYIPTGLANNSIFSILDFEDAAARSVAVRMALTTATYRFHLYAATSQYINITTTNAWYWIALLGHRNTTSTLRVFTDALAEVGSGVSANAADRDVSRLYVGPVAAPTANAISFYIDNVLLDFSANAATNYPILPA